MRRWMLARLVTTAATVLATAGVINAQNRPNFSGSWVYAEEKSKMNEGFSVTLSFPSELVIKQSAAEIHMIGSSNHLQPIESVYKLDGSESTFDTAAGRVRAKATWQGATLVINGTRTYPTPVGDVAVNTKEVYSLSGDVLTVERTQETAGASTSSGVTVYTRVKGSS